MSPAAWRLLRWHLPWKRRSSSAVDMHFWDILNWNELMLGLRWVYTSLNHRNRRPRSSNIWSMVNLTRWLFAFILTAHYEEKTTAQSKAPLRKLDIMTPILKAPLRPTMTVMSSNHARQELILKVLSMAIRILWAVTQLPNQQFSEHWRSLTKWLGRIIWKKSSKNAD